MSHTFTLTIAREDDQHNTYSADVLEDQLVMASVGIDVALFTIAHGSGIDTATGQREPVTVVQGFGDPTNVARFYDRAATIARAMNQRAIGWFESDDSYHELP